MALGYDIKLDRVATAGIRRRLAGAPESVRMKAHDAALGFASQLASEAAGRARRTPSGLWKRAGGARYNVRDRGEFITVQTPGGAAGRALAMSEFASRDRSGKKLGQTLDRIYGPPGRILWATYDSQETSWIQAIERAVDEAAREIEEGR